MIFPCLQGSKAQLEQVWEETDGLEAKDFNPKTFFKLHGMCYGVFQFFCSEVCHFNYKCQKRMIHMYKKMQFCKVLSICRNVLCQVYIM